MPRSQNYSLEEINALKRQGMTQAQIAEALGTTPAVISYYINTYGGYKTKRQEIGEHFPWKVPARLQGAAYKIVRDHAEYFATDGEGMSETKLKKLQAWYDRLRHYKVVLEYDPGIPPVPGVSKHGGFAYRPWVPEDDNYVIRRNQYTTITPEGETIWQFPLRDPLVRTRN